jgi:glutaminyl-peptide cyclotransferase
MMLKRVTTYWIILLIALMACEGSKNPLDGSASKNARKSVTVPSFNNDSAYVFIEKQVRFGPRVPNTDPHKLCANYLINKLKSYKAEVIVQEFVEQAYNGQMLNLKNIIGSYNPEAKKRVLLAAHWDTRPFADKDSERRNEPIDGANDGASGVGVLLEIARTMSKNELPNIGVDIIFFDGEDYGEHEDIANPPMKNGRVKIWWCLGSQYWAANPHKIKYSAYYGILLDMVGGHNAQFYKEGGSMQFAPKVVQKVWTTARSLGYSNYFINTNSAGIIDDHIFVSRDAKIPMIDIVEYDQSSPTFYFADYHHTHQDNLSVINRQTLQAVGETVLYTIYNE